MMLVVEKGAGGGDGGVGDDMGEGMQCNDHPYRNNPGGICAFCLQEKLGKLISSSKSNPSFPISSSSSSPSFSSEVGGLASSSSSLSLSFLVPHSSSFTTITTATTTTTTTNNNDHTRLPRMIPFPDKVKKVVMAASDSNLVLERSKSSSVPRRHFFEANEYNPRKKKFWSFLNLSTKRRTNRDCDSKPTITAAGTSTRGDYADDDESPNSSHTSSSSFGRKVARSRSVGCGSRSFSGDFLERISTGFGDCTLRRVESQRETKPKSVHRRGTPVGDEAQRIERVKCGGIFGGFSSSSSYLQPSSTAAVVVAAAPPHSRSKSWGWAFASPMRAFTRPSGTATTTATKLNDKDGSRRDVVQLTPSKDSTATATASTETTPNLTAIPSLLAVRV